jgi:hypothetical protein
MVPGLEVSSLYFRSLEIFFDEGSIIKNYLGFQNVNFPSTNTRNQKGILEMFRTCWVIKKNRRGGNRGLTT